METLNPTCFVVSPIGSTGSPERRNADLVLKYILKPVLSALGYAEPVRSDTLSEPGVITQQIIRQLLTADLAIIDMTGRNPNVFYELAIRHCTGKPFIQLMSKGETIPFDVGTQRTIFYDRTDLADVDLCKEELRRQITAARAPGFVVESPVGKAMNFERLSSSTPTELVLAALSDRIGYVAKVSERVIHVLENRGRHLRSSVPRESDLPPPPEPTDQEVLSRLEMVIQNSALAKELFETLSRGSREETYYMMAQATPRELYGELFHDGTIDSDLYIRLMRHDIESHRHL